MNENKLDYSTFTDKVSELKTQDHHKYGSVQFPAREALGYFIGR